ncbi:DUF6990 domain-containing protein [Fuscovulum blasticum]|uniref:DUF6990 domain-containing protein n=1 Tax=Fuscovulum blasticum TaxID=1075 RepID=UPI000F51661A|nr:hypothetical protein [Fuscovulum blasticum]
MNASDVAGVFKQLGWTPGQDVDRYAEIELSDRIVHVGFKVKDFTVYQKFESTHSLMTIGFTNAVKWIEGGRREINDRLKVGSNEKVRFQEPAITRKHIEIACNRAIEWAMSFDINQRYEELCNLDPSTPGAAGVWHLASLVLLGNVIKLKSYQASFESGDRLGFVNYVTKDYIDRAVVLAEKAAPTS